MREKIKKHPLILFSDFRKLFIARLISSIGDKFFLLSLSWLVLSMDNSNSALHLSIVMAANIIPVVIFGPFMGTIADCINRKTCLVLADIVRAFFMAILAFLVCNDNYTIWSLFILSFLIATFTPLFESATNASIEILTDEESISQAVALDSMVLQVSNLLGAFLGGVVIYAVGIKGAFIFNALSFIVSLVIILFIHTNLSVKKSTMAKNFRQEFGQGFKYILSIKPLFALIIFFLIFNFFVSPIAIFIPLIVKFVINEQSNWLAILEGAVALGSVIITLLLSFRNDINEKMYKKIFISVLTMGISMSLIGLSTNRYIIALCLFITGCTLAHVNATAYGFFQKIVPDYLKGRFFAILTTMCFSIIPITYIINGALTNIVSVSTVVFYEGMLSVLAAFIIIFIPKYQLGGDNYGLLYKVD
ncbi:MFS transporter [Vallitalea guaymasensis]|uniref:MFS transporter n=1 Tax=Vallitalea guaymasensis TaxID=1185412 RepID=A0A8J8SDU5_9FIRM|nr:MFS transporter [Vallitalea guaymasensis]QUH31223.1 MFS transporter [Vallitalea guaymasensis]